MSTRCSTSRVISGRRIDGGDKAELAQSIEAYRREEVPLVVPMKLLRHYFRRHPDDYIDQQWYLDPLSGVAGPEERDLMDGRRHAMMPSVSSLSVTRSSTAGSDRHFEAIGGMLRERGFRLRGCAYPAGRSLSTCQ